MDSLWMMLWTTFMIMEYLSTIMFILAVAVVIKLLTAYEAMRITPLWTLWYMLNVPRVKHLPSDIRMNDLPMFLWGFNAVFKKTSKTHNEHCVYQLETYYMRFSWMHYFGIVITQISDAVIQYETDKGWSLYRVDYGEPTTRFAYGCHGCPSPHGEWQGMGYVD